LEHLWGSAKVQGQQVAVCVCCHWLYDVQEVIACGVHKCHGWGIQRSDMAKAKNQAALGLGWSGIFCIAADEEAGYDDAENNGVYLNVRMHIV